MIEWILSTDSKIVSVFQLGSTLLLGLSNFVVTAVALIIGYRTNFGWKPVVLVTQQVVRDESDFTLGTQLAISFEVWNRWKYPIVLRWLIIRFRNEKAQFDNVGTGWSWHDNGFSLWRDDSTRLEPNSFLKFDVSARFKVDADLFRLPDVSSG